MFEFDVRDHIARITLARAPLNTLSPAWAAQLETLLDELAAREDWQVLHLLSNQRVFSVGGDIKEFAARLRRPDAGQALATEAAIYQRLFARIEALRQVTIAEIGGACVGGGLELALACDVRIVSANARLGLPEVGLGLLASAGGTQRLTRLCGPATALRLLGTSELVLGEEALRIGLAQWCVSPEQLPSFASEIVKRFAEQPSEALLQAKACIRAALDDDSKGFEMELAAPPTLMKTAQTQERLNAWVERSQRDRNSPQSE